MILPILSLAFLSFAISWLGTLTMKHVAPRIGFVDRPGGRKIHGHPKPLGGGVAIFWAFFLPMLVGLALVNWGHPPAVLQGRIAHLNDYWSGMRQRTPLAMGMLLAAAIMHLMGLMDDRKAMGPYSKLLVQLATITGLVVALPELRILSWIGSAPSIVLTILWIAAITNAFNFLDNMDGLSSGVAAVCTAAFLVATLGIHPPQLFVAAALSLLLGALLGFLCFNFNPASIFMGDSGSLVIGLLLGTLTVRTTYLQPGQRLGGGWYEVFAPVIVLAVPLYDLIVVSTIRVLRGHSPFKGDTNHFSHRLVARGMSKRTAVLCLYLISAATAVAAIILPHVPNTFTAVLVFVQTVLILGVVMLLEQHPLPVPRDVEDKASEARQIAVNSREAAPREKSGGSAFRGVPDGPHERTDSITR